MERDGMRYHHIQAAMLALVIGACSASPSEGQPPASASTRPFTVQAVSQFTTPWAMAFLPGSGRPLTNLALVSEKEGKLWLVDVATGQRREVAGVPPVRVAGQGGLGDVVPGPNFASDRRVYLSFVEAGPDDTAGAAIGYGTLEMTGDQPRIENFKLIWRQNPKVTGNGHFAHRIVFAPDGTMFVSSGDRQKFDPAQDMNGNLGKILRLDGEGRPAAGNPWARQGGIAAEFWSIGHRNNLGLALTPSGQLWTAEMGPKMGDELNLVEPGRNYGWPLVSDGDHYDGRPIPDHRTRPEFEKPVLSYPDETIAPGGMIAYTGDRYGWNGSLLLAGLGNQSLIRYAVNGRSAREADRFAMGVRIREVEQGPDGVVYLLEDGRNGAGGRLVRLVPSGR